MEKVGPLVFIQSSQPLTSSDDDLVGGGAKPTGAPASVPAPPNDATADLVSEFAPSTKAPPKDWCGSKGSEWVPEGFGGVNFSDACKRHDECYATPDARKQLCDYNLEQDISLSCAAQGGGLLCQVTAGVYYEAVHWFGGDAFERAQNGSK